MNGHERLVKLLLRQGANPKQANAKGKTPLDATNAIKPNIKALLTVRHVLQAHLNGLWTYGLTSEKPEVKMFSFEHMNFKRISLTMMTVRRSLDIGE